MSMKICKDCGTEVSKSAEKCPKCGRKMKRKWLGIVLGLIIVLIGICALVQDTDTVPASAQGENNAVQEKLSIIEHKTEKDGYFTYITGTIKNNTNKNYTYVQVEINLYDAQGNLINSTLDNINNLEPNGTWKFKAMTTNEFTTYKIKDVTGW